MQKSLKQMQKMKLSSLYTLLLLFLVQSFSAQLTKGSFVDGIAAVVGTEVILDSEVNEQLKYIEQQGLEPASKCKVFESVLNNKIIISEAKKDTLIENRSEQIRSIAEQKYNQILSQFPSEKAMLDNYKISTAYEMKRMIEKIDTDQYYAQEKFRRITQGIDATPFEITDFYNNYKEQLPEVKDEVILSQISIFPKLREAHKKELIDRLNMIRQAILDGESFENQARIYSEDKASAVNGGKMKNITKGQMVKPFEAAALNLEVGQISAPIETEFGFHIIRLDAKKGKNYDASHILLMNTPNDEEIATAKKKLENIRKEIIDGKITFKEAAVKYSDDKRTKYNAGVMTDENGSDRMEKINLDPILGYQVAGLNEGDMTEVFETTVDRKKAVSFVKINTIIPAHQLSLETDYDRLKDLTLKKKQNEMIEKWVKEVFPKVYMNIHPRYQDCHSLLK